VRVDESEASMRRAPALLAPVVAITLVVSGCSSTKSGTGSQITLNNSGGTTTSSSASSSSSSSSSGSDLSSLSASELVDKSKQAAKDAKSLKIEGGVIESDQTVELSLAYAENGTSGYVTTQGYKIEIIQIGQVIYFKAPDAFWKAQAGANAAAVLAKVSGKWIKTSSTDSDFSDFSTFTDKDSFLDQLYEDTSDVSKGDPATINGVDCLALSDTTGTLYVAGDDARPIELSGKDPSKGGTVKLDFTEYNSVPAAQAPPPAQTIDASTLGG
jgi:hypothetical protein